MDSKTAIRMIESGNAQCIYTTILLVKIDGEIYISFDGNIWERSDSFVVKEQF